MTNTARMTNTPPPRSLLTRDHVKLCLDQCVSVSNWHFEEGRFKEAKRWHEMAVEWQAKLDAFDADVA